MFYLKVTHTEDTKKDTRCTTYLAANRNVYKPTERLMTTEEVFSIATIRTSCHSSDTSIYHKANTFINILQRGGGSMF